MAKVKDFLSRCSNLLYPKDIKCIACDEELCENNDYCLCQNCFNSLPKIENCCKFCGLSLSGEGNVCNLCKTAHPNFAKAVACFNYDGVAKNLIYKLKYSGAKYLGSYLSKILCVKLKQCNFTFDVVLPVPICAKRLKKRGYNQSQLLCQGILDEFNKQDLSNILIRSKQTPTQTVLSRVERAQNLKDAFQVLDASKIKGKTVLLVDDVFTTGATASEITKVLLNAGASKVYVITLCHTQTPQFVGE